MNISLRELKLLNNITKPKCVGRNLSSTFTWVKIVRKEARHRDNFRESP